MAFLIVSNNLHALPDCPSDTGAHWHNCFGTLTLNNGDKYVGEWKDGKRHGQGTYTFANGDKYVGEYRDGKENGQGTHTSTNGDKYVGEWRDGKQHGQGTAVSANGDKYVGEFRDGKVHGRGIGTSADGGKYVGEFRNSSYHGQGTYTFANGEQYVGEYRDGKEHGRGTYTLPNGDTYFVEMRDGEYVGQDTQLTNPAYSEARVIQSQLPDCKGGDSTSYSMCYGVVENDTFAYEGEWKNGLRSGVGLLTYSDGKRSYKGQWSEGNASGYGVFRYADGSVYVGRWKQNKRHGKGRLTLATGAERSGTWIQDKLLPAEILKWAYSVMSKSLNVDFSNLREGTIDAPGPPISETCSAEVAARIQTVWEEEARRVIDAELDRFLYALVIRLSERLGVDAMVKTVNAMKSLPNLSPEERADFQQGELGESLRTTVLPEIQRSVEAIGQSLGKSMVKIFSVVEEKLASEGINKVSANNWCLK